MKRQTNGDLNGGTLGIIESKDPDAALDRAARAPSAEAGAVGGPPRNATSVTRIGIASSRPPPCKICSIVTTTKRFSGRDFDQLWRLNARRRTTAGVVSELLGEQCGVVLRGQRGGDASVCVTVVGLGKGLRCRRDERQSWGAIESILRTHAGATHARKPPGICPRGQSSNLRGCQ